MTFYNNTSITALALALIALPGMASAQATAEPQAAEAPQDGIQDIVVTAQRTASSIQRTPISMQAYSGAELQQRGVSDIASLARADSSININLSTGQPIIAIRGVSSQNATEVGDPAVSVATDGVFTNRPYGTFGGLYDVERVEILRGPQGTLFGRNSTGGTINVITARPTDTNEARFTIEGGNYNLIGGDGFGNFAIADGLNGRVSFNVRSRKGYRDNGTAFSRGDDEDLKSVRFQLGFDPSDALSGWILAQYTEQGGQGNVAEVIPFVYKNGESGEPVHAYPASISDGKSFPLYAPYRRDLKHFEFRGGLTYRFENGMSVNYLGGYDKINYLRQQNINPFFGGAASNGPIPVPFIYRNREKPETINQEIRLASDPQSHLSWQVGAYYFRETSSVDAVTIFNPDTSAAATGIRFLYPSIKSNSKALFAQASYGITDQLKFTAGGRYTWDEKSRAGTFFIYPAQTGLPFTIEIPQPASTKSHKPTWTLGLDYQWTPRNLLYAKVSTGYKVGGFNDAVSSYGPETVRSYEIGSKNSFLDNHLQLNLSAFRMDYKDQQVTQFVSGTASSGSATVNAGKSRIWGAEFNLVAQSGQLGRLSASANYTHARYLAFLSSAGWDSTVNLDFAGNTLPLAPTWSASAQYEYPITLSNGGKFTPNVAVKYQSSQYFAPNNYADQKQGAYAFLDAGLMYEPDGGAWNLQAYVKNITDKTVLSDAGEFYTFNNYTYSYQPPRTYGLRLTVNIR